MKIFKVILIASILISISLFIGCTEEEGGLNDEAKKFVGIWVNNDNSATYVFYSKGTFTFDSLSGEQYEGGYEVKNDLLLFTYTYPSEISGDVESFNYNFSNNDETFTISPYEHPEYSSVFYKQ